MLSNLSVRGFKSHRDWTRLDLRPLTLLVGANSSGKSSALQPLLLLKQTIDQGYLRALEPSGSLKLDGPNVRFTRAEEFLSKKLGAAQATDFEVEIAYEPARGVKLKFERAGLGVALTEATYRTGSEEITLREGAAPPALLAMPWFKMARMGPARIVPMGGFMALRFEDGLSLFPSLIGELANLLWRSIHLPGLRGNPERSYQRTQVGQGGGEPGIFSDRFAAIVSSWQEKGDEKLGQLSQALLELGLTSRVETGERDASSLEIRIGRTSGTSPVGSDDLVSIADVGLGVSQALPVAVALVHAEPGQVVYLEQPEIHLHPRAQKAVADLIAQAVRRGVQVIVETHSEILLTRLQWQVARENDPLPFASVIGHWFERDPKAGLTTVRSVVPDASGALGEPSRDFADFAEVAEEVDRDYNEAAFARLPVADS